MSRLIQELEKIECEYSELYDMSRYTTMRLGGTVDLLISPRTSAQLTQVLGILSELDIEWVTLGGGSNVILPEHLGRVVLSTKRIKRFEILEGCVVELEAGAMLSSVMNATIQADLTGFEFTAGIPGTAGGAVVMNAIVGESMRKVPSLSSASTTMYSPFPSLAFEPKL